MKSIKEKRMLEIMNSLEESKEVFKNNEKSINVKKINEENARLKKLISSETNEDFKELNENYYIAGKFGTGGRGKTVNSLIDDYRDTSVIKTPKVSSSNLKPEEAIEISIKRVLKSGMPINNIGFYEEVNWNLMNLGFPAVNEIDIKNAVLSMIGE